MISVKQSYNPSHLPCRIRLLAHRNDCRCDYTTCLAATKRSECTFHFCDFECPVSTNRYLGIKNSLVAAEGLESLQEVGFEFIFATDATAIAVDNNHIVRGQGSDSASVGARYSGQPSFAEGRDFEGG